MPKPYLLTDKNDNRNAAKGKVVSEITTKADVITITFTDGTWIEIKGDRPEYGALRVYLYKNES